MSQLEPGQKAYDDFRLTIGKSGDWAIIEKRYPAWQMLLRCERENWAIIEDAAARAR